MPFSNSVSNAGFGDVAVLVKRFWWDVTWTFQEWGKIEPYLVTVATDESKEVFCSTTPIYSGSARKGAIELMGHGHLCYGPRDPGRFFTLAVGILESDADIRSVGERMDQILKSDEFKTGAVAVRNTVGLALTASGYGAAAAAALQGIAVALEETLKIIARLCQGNQDDILFIRSGSFLRDLTPPYQWGRRLSAESEGGGQGKSRYGVEYEVCRLAPNVASALDAEAKSGERFAPARIELPENPY